MAKSIAKNYLNKHKQGINTMRKTFTIATRPNGSKGQFVRIAGLPLMSLAQANKAIELAKNKSNEEFVILNTAAQ